MKQNLIERKIYKTWIVPIAMQFMRACYYIEGRFNYEAANKPLKESYKNTISSEQDGNHQIKHILETGSPCMISRIGSTELACIDFYYRHRIKKANTKSTKSVLNWIFFQSMKYRAWRGSGVFPPTDDIFDKFSQFFLDNLTQIDVMGVWFNTHEDSIINEFCPKAKLVPLTAIEPYYHPEPWSAVLHDKKVLVVHPFSHSIESQYDKNSHRLFQDKSILPNFDLKVIQAVQSLSLWPDEFVDWFDAYEHMCYQISQVDFDIAIIGAGAYGLPLASFVKNMGKQAIHMAGATQILFGIKGARWDSHPVISKLYNKFWVRPLEQERPKNFKRQENGCYW